MEDMARIIGSNIDKYISDSNSNYKEIAAIIDVTEQTLKHYINGENTIDSAKLLKLSRYFNIELKDFLNSDQTIDSSNFKFSFLFRAKNPRQNITLKDYNFLNKLFNQYYELLSLGRQNKLVVIPESYNLKIEEKITPEIDQIIKQLAEKERLSLNLPTTIKDYYESLEKIKNINIIAVPYNNRDLEAVSGYSTYKGAYIFINDNEEIAEERKLFSLIHEYGHLLFHKDLYLEDNQNIAIYSTEQVDINEQIVDTFAGYLLIPPQKLAEEVRNLKEINLDTIFKLKKEFSVSTRAILKALHKAKHIDTEKYKSLLKQLTKNYGTDKEPEPINYQSKNRILYYRLKQLYLEDKITSNMISEVLNLDNLTTRMILKDWRTNEKA